MIVRVEYAIGQADIWVDDLEEQEIFKNKNVKDAATGITVYTVYGASDAARRPLGAYRHRERLGQKLECGFVTHDWVHHSSSWRTLGVVSKKR